MASNVNIDTESDDIQRELLVKFECCNKYRAPLLFSKEDFYTVYSPKKFKLKPREDIVLNLHFNIHTSKELDPWISLLPTLKTVGLTLISKTVNSKNEMEVHLQNQSYHYTVRVKKEQALAFIFLLGKLPRDLIRTEYDCEYDSSE